MAQTSSSPLFSSAFRLHLFWWAGWLLFLGGAWIMMGYEDSFLWLNSFRWPWLDSIMPHYTHAGDGLVVSVWVGVLFWHRRKDVAPLIGLAITMLLIGAIIYVAKQYVYPDADRPFLRFVHKHAFFEISLNRLMKTSFPSGHSAAAAGVSAVAAFYARKPLSGLFWGILGLLGAYSRVYIGVHFVGDIVIGSLIGLLVAIGINAFLVPLLRKTLARYPRFEIWLAARAWYVIVWIGVAAVIRLIWRYYLDQAIHLDLALLGMINGAHSSWLDQIMWLISTKWAWIPLYIYLLWRLYQHWGWKRVAGLLIAVAALIAATDQISASFLKPWIGRFRPCRPEAGLDFIIHLVNNKCGGAYGFVSSHASNFFGLAAFLTAFLPRRGDRLILWIAAILVAYSRVYLGVHYPGDVIGGAILGIALGQIGQGICSVWIRPVVPTD